MKAEPRRFELGEGWIALVGRTDVENDELTFNHAFPQDLWFHAKGCPGSHVILQHASQQEPPKMVVEAAARLALTYSKARRVKKGAVSMARISDLAKAKGAPAGQVILRKSRTITVHRQGSA